MKYTKGEFITIPNKSALRGLSPNLQVLFFWLCDHSDESLQSFPSRKALAEECGMSIDSVDRGMRQLVELGMVKKTARSNGVEQTTNLYEILMIDAVSDTLAAETKGVAADSGEVAAKTTLGGRKNRTRNSTHLTQPIKLNTTNVVGETPGYGKTEINELFAYWKEKTGVGIESKRQANRNACNNLYRKYGTEKLRQLIDGVALAQQTPYAPRVADFCDLQAKLTQLLTWGKSRSTTQKRTIKI